MQMTIVNILRVRIILLKGEILFGGEGYYCFVKDESDYVV